MLEDLLTTLSRPRADLAKDFVGATALVVILLAGLSLTPGL